MEQIKRKGLSGNALKIIAIVSMLIDHIGAAIVEEGLLPRIYSSVLGGRSVQYMVSDHAFWVNVDNVLRFTGRLAFPIFCFLMVEGFLHTRNVMKYALRLGVFCILSEIPFDLAFHNQMFEWKSQNVFFTLLIGLLVMAAIKYTTDHLFNEKTPIILTLLSKAVIITLGAFLAEFMHTDYGWFGVVAISILYLLHESRIRQCIIGAVMFIWELTAPISFLILYFYNGERGKFKMKYFFYVFYPLHLILLYFVRCGLFPVA